MKALCAGVMLGIIMGSTSPVAVYAEMGNSMVDNNNSLARPHSKLFYLYKKKVNVNTEERKNNAKKLIMEGNDYALALAELNLVIELDKEDAEAYLLRAFAYTEMDKFQEAENDYKAALMIEPENPTFYYYRGVNFLLAKNNSGNDYTNSIVRGEGIWAPRNLIKAMEMFNKAVKLEPNYVDAIVGMGDVCYATGEKGNSRGYTQAIDYYNKVLVLFRNNDVIKAKKEMAEQALRDIEQAKAEEKRKEELKRRIG